MNKKELDRAVNDSLSILDDADASMRSLLDDIRKLRRELESIPEEEEIEPNPVEDKDE